MAVSKSFSKFALKSNIYTLSLYLKNAIYYGRTKIAYH